MKSTLVLLLLAGLAALSLAAKLPHLHTGEDHDDDHHHHAEEEEEKRPYSFAYKASRYYNGNPDREHQEMRGADGITRGVFRYVDPLQQVQEVVYYSDENGFQVEASNLPKNTAAVARATQNFHDLFERIQQEHQKIADERGHEYEEPVDYEPIPPEELVRLVQQPPAPAPRTSAAVARATELHGLRFEKIFKEHQRIAQERLHGH
ncbi:uncharacterized protein LOC143032203 [Oratosquilla oratoria]|uniref:uncharacterized protein LOC143032203 n=1 Tax=Oratosquilla oratoria TaxID=337810 RepID=UPI003F75E722